MAIIGIGWMFGTETKLLVIKNFMMVDIVNTSIKYKSLRILEKHGKSDSER